MSFDFAPQDGLVFHSGIFPSLLADLKTSDLFGQQTYWLENCPCCLMSTRKWSRSTARRHGRFFSTSQYLRQNTGKIENSHIWEPISIWEGQEVCWLPMIPSVPVTCLSSSNLIANCSLYPSLPHALCLFRTVFCYDIILMCFSLVILSIYGCYETMYTNNLYWNDPKWIASKSKVWRLPDIRQLPFL